MAALAPGMATFGMLCDASSVCAQSLLQWYGLFKIVSTWCFLWSAESMAPGMLLVLLEELAGW